MSRNRKLSRIELIRAHDLLKQHLMPGSSEGYFKYQDDWSDAKIASELASDIQAQTIGGVRLDLFGKLDSAANAAREDNKRIADLETMNKNLIDCYQRLETKHNLLVDTLMLNKIVPTSIKHLKTTHNEGKE